LHSIEGTISGKPYHSTPTGRLHDPEECRSGTIHGSAAVPKGKLDPGFGETSDSAAAELNGLISSLGSLAAQAQTLPMSPPTLPALPQGGYRPQPTDYAQFSDDAN
jgi:hypothetical protein